MPTTVNDIRFWLKAAQAKGARVIPFPRKERGRPPTGDATILSIYTERLRNSVGAFLNWLRVPGAIRSVEIDDDLSGQQIVVTVGRRFVRLSINDRDYFFDRVTGRFDGTGSKVG